jgi:hypothetical protein
MRPAGRGLATPAVIDASVEVGPEIYVEKLSILYCYLITRMQVKIGT